MWETRRLERPCLKSRRLPASRSSVPTPSGSRGFSRPSRTPARLRLLSLIQSAPKGEASVSDLIAPLGLSQPTVSHR
ncbi:regulatory protein, arsR family [Micromonospora cremea]|uniref:Regulatory protein, arsR family n=1 Tax=Micromonospora cremea TaxID=709881 RepID=A0A1N5TD87_9ACTN|nr:regulatory protein, arsR family [Micromonospora cremea]